MMSPSVVFKDFGEYWYYARHLSKEQRKMLYDSLPQDQRKTLQESYISDKWSDLLYRNQVNDILDELKERYGYDVLDIRAKALKGKSVYIPSKFWEILTEEMGRFNPENVKFVMSGLRAVPCEENSAVVLVVADTHKKQE